jgi:HAD superfamily hydrolase (TIGR01549 family)
MIPPQVLRWDFYRRAGYNFPQEVLKQAHRYARDKILATPNRESWSLAVATEWWFIYEAEYLGLDIRLVRQWASQHAKERLLDLTKARSAILELSRDYELALISNNIGNLDQVLAEVGLRSAFRIIVDSSECGYHKPDPRIFYEAQKRAGIANGSDCWYLGDKFETDVIGALKAGWNAAWLVVQIPHNDIPKNVIVVTSLQQFRDELDKRYRNRPLLK